MTVLRLGTTDGVDLAAEAVEARGSRARAAAVLLHPHPLMGGDMHAPVPELLFHTLPAEGIAVLRFDFRGAGGSGGTHGGGTAEAADVRAAVDWLATSSGMAVWLVGWSFGADVSLQVTDDPVAGWIAIAPPLRVVPPAAMAAALDPRPKLLLVPEHDQFNPPAAARAHTEPWASTEVREVAGADHFLAGRMGVVTDAVVATLAGTEA